MSSQRYVSVELNTTIDNSIYHPKTVGPYDVRKDAVLRAATVYDVQLRIDFECKLKYEAEIGMTKWLTTTGLNDADEYEDLLELEWIDWSANKCEEQLQTVAKYVTENGHVERKANGQLELASLKQYVEY